MDGAGQARVPGADELSRVLKFISDRKGIDLCSYRQNFCFRHLRSRMRDAGIATGLDYVSYIKRNPGEIDRFLDELSINVTHFFRDREVFRAFEQKALPLILEKKTDPEKSLIRVWSAACASGQEPYSLAIMLTEALQARKNIVVKIWATDVDADALARAQEGLYEERDLREVDKKLLEKYFEPVYNGKYSVREDIRSLVRFEKHNLITDPALKFMDIIFCRNVMIYFAREQQEILLEKFHNALNSRGFLVLAKVESVWGKDSFSNFDLYNKIYRKAD
jgi:chemotaxis protein methyltransferase CheR